MPEKPFKIFNMCVCVGCRNKVNKFPPFGTSNTYCFMPIQTCNMKWWLLITILESIKSKRQITTIKPEWLLY